MNAGVVFVVAVLAVVPAWVLLIAAPTSRAANAVVHRSWIFLAVAVVYVVAVAIVGADPSDLASWDGVRRLYEDEVMVLVSWLHFVAVDLFVGAWQARDAARLRLPRVATGFCVLMTFSMAPVGLAAYLLLRWRHTGGASISEDVSDAADIAPGIG